MLKIDGKTFMNLQEAVQWLLDNNALPFQSSANYVANTEIGFGTIANPSPAKVRIGSLILFADSKVATVIGLTDSGFMVGTQNVDIKNALAYISSIGLNASGYIITTLSDGTSINAGQVKQVSYFSIDASQHLIAHYNDGTSTDLGAIFSGNVTISGDLAVTGYANIFEKIKDSSGHLRFLENEIDQIILPATSGVTFVYSKWSLSGTHLMFVVAGNIDAGTVLAPRIDPFAQANFPNWIASKIVPIYSTVICSAKMDVVDHDTYAMHSVDCAIDKVGDYGIRISTPSYTQDVSKAGNFRIEVDLLIDND